MQVRLGGFVQWRTGGMRYIKFLNHVSLLCIHSDGEIRPQRPGSRRTDGDARSGREAVSFPYRCRRACYDWELHIDGFVVALLVFHFGFSEGGLRPRAPEDRLLRLV